ncbi:MAG: hypothetical protein QF719_07755 [Chloroflexota bacterium]|jgi:hypothetical protein|nr:hypothetical protein [Chloroflexota bacterium]MDP6758089.1 hypothetical protein [Chloroflexota bacterium]
MMWMSGPAAARRRLKICSMFTPKTATAASSAVWQASPKGSALHSTPCSTGKMSLAPIAMVMTWTLVSGLPSLTSSLTRSMARSSCRLPPLIIESVLSPAMPKFWNPKVTPKLVLR